jgi:hypothetical protein
MAKKVLTIRLEAKHIAELKAYADASGLSLAGVLQSLVEDRLAGRNTVVYKCPVNRRELSQTLDALRAIDAKVDGWGELGVKTRVARLNDLLSGVFGLGQLESDIANIEEVLKWSQTIHRNYTAVFKKTGEQSAKDMLDRSEMLINFLRRFVYGL